MSDDLVKRLRSGLSDFDDWDAAADRIEELEAKLAKAVETERERCAKVAEAVGVQRVADIDAEGGFDESYTSGLRDEAEGLSQDIAVAIRAELTGGKDE